MLILPVLDVGIPLVDLDGQWYRFLLAEDKAGGSVHIARSDRSAFPVGAGSRDSR
jgi:hypothetical protein